MFVGDLLFAGEQFGLKSQAAIELCCLDYFDNQHNGDWAGYDNFAVSKVECKLMQINDTFAFGEVITNRVDMALRGVAAYEYIRGPFELLTLIDTLKELVQLQIIFTGLVHNN